MSISPGCPRIILHFTIWTAVLLVAVTIATAYSTGSMSCKDIGDFAAATVVGKENGRSLEEGLQTVRKRTTGYPVERQNLTQIVRAIYTEAYAMHLSEEGARAAFTADCEAQQPHTKAQKRISPQTAQGAPEPGLSPYQSDENRDPIRHYSLEDLERIYGKDSEIVKEAKEKMEHGMQSPAMDAAPPSMPQPALGGGIGSFLIPLIIVFLIIFFVAFRPSKKSREQSQTGDLRASVQSATNAPTMQEYRRTCRACGKVWHSLIAREQTLSKQDTCGMCAAVSESTAAIQQTKRNEAARQSEIFRLRACPECGSANYSEEIVDYTPTSTD